MRSKLVEKSQAYHILIHVLFGILCALVVSREFDNENLFLLLLAGFIGNTIPDIDHILYYFTYGRDSEYSQIIKLFIKERHFREIRNFLRDNHKFLTGLYSHTLLSPIISAFLTFYFFKKNHIYISTFFLSVTVHFIYDILEDILFFKKLNPNWYFKLNKKNKNNEGILEYYQEFLKKLKKTS